MATTAVAASATRMDVRRTLGRAAPDPLPRRRARGATGPALQGSDASQQLAEVERLDEIVVRPAVEAADPVGRRVPGGEHEDRGRTAMATGPLDDLDAFRARHPPVDDRDVVVVELELVDRVIPAVDGVDVITAIGEAQDDHVPEAR